METGPRICGTCGASMDPGTSEGLCVACLLGAVIGPKPTEPVPLALAESLLEGRRFGGYELLGELGRGGMGIVFLARQSQPARLVALKVIAGGELASPRAVERFRREAEAAAALEHPNIVSIFEVGEEGGWPYLAMRRIDGHTLARTIADRRGSTSANPVGEIRDAAAMVAKIARIVHFAHQRGVLHRDLKPGNILLDAEGEPHLTDFGLAKLIEDDSSLTLSQAVLGTPGYMAPEQAAGGREVTTTATDVHGLGAILYELLAGQPPFVGASPMETLRKVMEVEPRRPSLLNPRVDRDLETICLKCLEKQPQDRYGSAASLADDLESWRRGEPVRARPATRIERLAKWARRHPRQAGLAVTSVVAAVALVVTLAVSAVRIGRAHRDTLRHAEASREQLVRRSVAAGASHLEDGDAYLALLWFVEALRLDLGRPREEEVHRRRIAATLHEAPRLVGFWQHESIPSEVVFSPDGRWLVSAGKDRTARIWDLATARPVLGPLRHDDEVYYCAFSADGRRLIASDAAEGLYFWDVVTGERLGKPEDAKPTWTGWSVDREGRWVLARARYGLGWFDSTGESPDRRWMDLGKPVHLARLSPDDRVVFVVAPGENGRLYDARTREPIGPELEGTREARHAMFSPDGSRLAVNDLWTLSFWDARTGFRLGPAVRPGGHLFDCQFSPNGEWVCVADWRGQAWVFDSANGRLVCPPMRHRNAVFGSSFDSKGDRLATIGFDGRAGVWNPATGDRAASFLPNAGYVLGARFSPDDSLLATAGQDGAVRLWDLRAPDAGKVRFHSGSEVFSLCFSPDGRFLLWTLATGEVHRFEVGTTNDPVRIQAGVREVRAEFSPDSHRILTLGADGWARLWDSATLTEQGEGLPHSGRLEGGGFVLGGRGIVTFDAMGRVQFWDAATRQSAGPLLDQGSPIARMTRSADGSRVAFGMKSTRVTVFDGSTRRAMGSAIEWGGVGGCVTFSPDGRYLATSTADSTIFSKAARVWDVATGQAISPPLWHRDGIGVADFSPDGRLLVTGGEDDEVRLWDWSTGTLLTPPMTHRDTLYGVSFSPNGRYVLTTSSDRTARVWDARTGEAVTPPFRHDGEVRRAAWSPDGEWFAVASDVGSVFLWNLSPAKESLEALGRQAELLSAHRWVPGVGGLPLEVEALGELWHRLRPRARSDSEPPRKLP